MADHDDQAKPISLFYSYSHKDEDLRLKLETHLSALRRGGLIAEWHDRKLEPGDAWKGEIDRHLTSADIVLLLVSADFIASDYCWGEEMTKALARHARGEARVIPVILRHCRWKSTPLADLQAVPRDAKPIRAWPDEDEAFDDVVGAIERAVQSAHQKTLTRPGSAPVAGAADSPAPRRDIEGWWTLTASLAWVMTRDPAVVGKLCGPLSAIDKGAIILEYAGRGKGVRESRDEMVNVLATGRVTAHGDCQDGRGLKPIPAVEWSRLEFGFESGSDAAGQYREVVLRRAEVVQHWPPKAGDALHAPGTVFRDIDARWCPEVVVIAAGSFVMGSPQTEVGHDPGEGPQHEVRFAQPFALERYPVTFEEYDHFCDQTGREKPSDQGWGRSRRPVINVSWEDTAAYCAWLGQQTGQGYRLPSEAEWEYACRAGTTTPFWTGATISAEQANYNGNFVYGPGDTGRYREQTTPVDSFATNLWGLHDMHGNVWQWCQDCWNESYAGAPVDGSAWLQGNCSLRVVRGGSWADQPRVLRSANRGRVERDDRHYFLGFRVARMLAR